MNLTLVKLREEQVEAHSAFTAAKDAVLACGADDDLDALQAAFDAAEERYKQAEAAYSAEVERQNTARKQFELQERARDAENHLSTPEEGADVKVKSEPLTYSRFSPNGFFRDLYRRDFAHDQAAADRLSRHVREMEVEQRAKFDLNSTDANGGYLVAPLWLQEQFVDLAKAGRVVTDAVGVTQKLHCSLSGRIRLLGALLRGRGCGDE